MIDKEIDKEIDDKVIENLYFDLAKIANEQGIELSLEKSEVE